MAENNPGKVDLASTELKVGGVHIKGSYIVWFFAVVSTVAGAIYAAGKVWSDYERLQKIVADIKMPDMQPLVVLNEKVHQMEEELVKVSQGLAEAQALGGKLVTDISGMQKLMEANDVSKLQGAISQLRTSVDGVQVFTRDVQAMREQIVGLQKDVQSVRTDLSKDISSLRSDTGKDLAVLKKDVDSQWNAIDSIGAGALKGK